MRLHGDAARDVLVDAWQRWAHRCGELTDDQWAAPTRCGDWDTAALIAHVCPDPAMFDRLNDAVVDQAPAVTDAAQLLRRFNEPDGIAHASADSLAAQALAEAEMLTPAAAASRFAECAEIARTTTMTDDIVIAYPTVGTTTLAVIAETALMEATVHLLDLADAVGGVEPSAQALAATRDLLIAVPDPITAIEVLAGRVQPGAAVPAIR